LNGSLFSLPFADSVALRAINGRFGSPYHVMLEVTTKCNIKCRTCLRSKQEWGISDSDMDLDLFHLLIRNLKYPTRFINFVGMGEQLLNPQIFDMMNLAKKKGFQISLTDNFTLVDKEVALKLLHSEIDYLYASFDSVSKDKFEKIRFGANFDEVVRNIKQFIEAKNQVKAKKPQVFFKSVISKKTVSEVPHLIEFAEELDLDGIDFCKEHSFYQNHTNDPNFYLQPKDLPPTKIEVILNEMGRIYPCQALPGCFVTFDGKVFPCDHMMQLLPRNSFARFQVGDIRFNTLAEIWRSEKYRRIRKNLASRVWLPFCEKCPAFHESKELI
jgi:radical SAM protein with 4Fe4S-binding SPASM domain